MSAFMVMPKKYDILLIEDDEVDIMSIQRSFRKNNIRHTLHIATDGQDALEKIQGINGYEPMPRPHLILMDINMPRMNGLAFLERLRNIDPYKNIPVFVLSTSNEAPDRATAFRYNVSGYVIKPLSPDSFDDTIVSLNRFWEMNEYL